MSEIKRDETLYRESYVLALQKENAELKEQIALFVGVETAAMEQGEKSLCVQLSEANAAQAKRIEELEEINGLLQTQVHCLELVVASKNGE